MTTAVALLLAIAVGWLAIRLARPAGGRGPRWAAILLEVSLGAGAGAVITSTVFLMLLAAGAATRVAQLAVEGVLLAGLLVWNVTRRANFRPARTAPQAGIPYQWAMVLALVIAVVIVIAAQVDSGQANPWGRWDAFALWTLRAKFLATGGDTWTRAASPLLETTKWDYPLLLSLFVARTWKIDGDLQSPAAGFGVSVLFLWAVIGLLVSGLSLTRGVPTGLLAALIMIATTSFLEQGTFEYADVPLAFFMLATFALAMLSRSENNVRYSVLALAGGAAGMAAWTKNEGLAFVIAATACCGAVTWRGEGLAEALRRLRWWAIGAAPGLVLVAWLHFGLAGGGAPARQTLPVALAKIADPGRWGQILSSSISGGIALGVGIMHPLLLLALLAILLRFRIDDRVRPLLWSGGSTLVLTLVAYLLVYLTSADDLAFQLGGSIDRLYSQIWPAFVFLAFLALRPPEPPPATEEAREAKNSKRKKKAATRRAR